METTDHATEGDPLKREDGAEAGTASAASQTEMKKKTCQDLGFTKLTHWRTAVFFFSLFLCLTIVFAFSFIIPCPVRPQYLISWNRTFIEAGTYDFLAVEDANKDKVKDMLFVLRDAQGTQNNTCVDAGLSSPCLFLMAVDGTDGETLWERPLESKFQWAQCGLEKDTGRNWDCLLSHSNQFTAIDKYTGDIRWQKPQPPGLKSSRPVLSVPDLDGDKVSDVALVAQGNPQAVMFFLSGKTGDQIGSAVSLNATETVDHISHLSKEGSYYVLLQKDTGVFGMALWRIAAQAKEGMEKDLKIDQKWEKMASATSGLVPVYESDSLIRVLRTETEPFNLLLETGTEVALVDGQTLQILWKYNTSSVLRQKNKPTFGHFNKDNNVDVVVEENIGNNTKKVIVLDGESGGVLWYVDLLATPNSPPSSSILTTNSFSVFMLWGVLPSEANWSVPLTSDRRSYMLHPLHYKVLLESTHVMDHIVSFKATLLEHGRHAAYITLFGPETEGADGTVILSKRKLKQDVPDSKVVPIGTGGDIETKENIKEAFNRLRFSDD